MRRMKYITATLLLMLILTACGNKSHQTESITYDDKPTVELPMPETATVPVQEDTPKEEKKQSVSYSRTSSRSHSDNMRGFNPVSEDDMDDNGMSRYMENNLK